MPKKSYIHAISQNMLTMPMETRYHRFKKAMALVNYVFTTLLHVPDGYCRCPDCMAVRAVHPYHEKELSRNFIKHPEGDVFLFSYCATCRGVGYISCKQAINHVKGGKYTGEYLVLPCITAEFSIDEIGSIMFYLVFNRHSYLGLDLALKYAAVNKLQKKIASDFIAYFNHYKLDRDRRNNFIKYNLKELRAILKKRINTGSNTNRYDCIRCNGDPFDIIHETALDTIVLTICGNCRGTGVEPEKDTATKKEKLIFPIENPDYTDKERMIDSLLNNAYVYRRLLTLSLTG